MGALLEEKISIGMNMDAGDVFQTGNYEVKGISVTTSHTTKPPVDLFIVSPVQKGTYPLLLFCHGFMLTNTWYTTLLNHIASHGYILIAPKYCGVISCSIPEEVRRAAKVTEWLSAPTGLPLVLPENVAGDTDRLALSGHSRGGKTAFALALGRIDDDKSSRKKKKKRAVGPNPYNFKVLIGIDPVGGISPSSRPPPNILKYIPRCFEMSVPVAVIGTGYGNQSKGMVPPFSPDGVNHSEFYNESKPPASYFLAKEYGHVDMMDDNWYVNMLRKFFCKSGNGSMDLMRRGVGGIVVAFLRCYLDNNDVDLKAIVDDPTTAPIILDPVIYVKQ